MPDVIPKLESLPGSPDRRAGRRSKIVVTGLLTAFVALACAVGDGDRPERVVLVSIDTLRADHVGFMGSSAGATPALDALARRGTVFETTLSPAPLTLPSHATLLTGLDPPSHGVHHNGLFSLDARFQTLAESARGAGLRTAAFVAAVVLDRRYGMAAGFDHYDDEIEADVRSDGAFAERPAERVVDRAVEWMDRTDGHFFAWVHLYDPHLPWRAPEAFIQRFGDGYVAEIAYADAQIGRLIEFVDTRWSDGRTLWIVTSDHGESLGEHGERSHAYLVYEATQRVPLVMAGPGIPSRGRVSSLARLADVAPTVLARLGIEQAGPLDGRDLFDAPPASPLAYSETRAGEYDHGWSSLYSIRSEDRHYIRAPRPELYDLERDPHEVENLAADRPLEVQRLDAALEALLSRAELHAASPTRDSAESGAERVELSAADRAELAALGYLPRVEAEVRAFGAVGGLSPSEGLLEANRWLRGRQLLENGRGHAAFGVLCEVATESPRIGLDCARAALATGQLAMAEKLVRERLHSHPDAEELLVEILIARGDLEEAEARLQRSLERQPDSGAALAALGRIENARGHVDRALDLYGRAAEARWPAASARAHAAVLLLREHRADEARSLLASLGEDVITRPEIAAQLVEAFASAGDLERARALLGRALQRSPDAEAFEPLLDPERGLATTALAVARGRRLLELGKPDRAYRVLTDLDLDAPTLQLDRAWAAIRSGRPDRARDYAEAAGENRWKQLTVAEILIRQGAWDEAERLVRDLERSGLRYADLDTMRGRIAEGRGDERRAIEIYTAASQGDRPSREALWRLAALRIESGDRSGAEAALSAFHVVDPYANARLVEAELAAGSVERARRRLADALTRHPDADALVALEEKIETEAAPRQARTH